MQICVVGLGHVGLPTAVLFASNGLSVHGWDTDPVVAGNLRQGKLHPPEQHLDALLQRTTAVGNLRILSRLEAADVFVIAVPTPTAPDRTANLTALKQAVSEILPHLRRGALVSVESTVPCGTCESVIAPLLETSGLLVGRELHLAYVPERAFPGNFLAELSRNTRIIGADEPAAQEAAVSLYSHIVEGDIRVTDLRTAEFVKLVENASRDVNIALANELSLIARKARVNIWDAISLANEHPRVQLLRPGPGVGGHCIPVDPWFLLQEGAVQHSLILSARLLNESMPTKVLQFATQQLGGRQCVLGVLGVTYKENVEDLRNSPALRVVGLLRRAGHQVRVHDPRASALALHEYACDPVDLHTCTSDADAMLVLVGHDEFKRLDPLALRSNMRGHIVIDVVNCLDHARWRRAGFDVRLFGQEDLPQGQSAILPLSAR